MIAVLLHQHSCRWYNYISTYKYCAEDFSCAFQLPCTLSHCTVPTLYHTVPTETLRKGNKAL